MDLRSCSSSFTYDVFLSFRGEDTLHGFTGHLYKALDNKGIRTFIDEEIQKGEEITPALVTAIQESRIAIVVLSKYYASSSFCLEELATILKWLKVKDRWVLPVFYKVDPSEVRHQIGSYGKALAGHEERFKAEKKLEKWKMALNQVAEFSGYHFKDGSEYEYKFIEKIVEKVSRVINRIPLPVADYPVGLESQVEEVRKLLDVGSDDGVHMIGIHGMGGIGKSTLARAVYNNLIIAENFDGLCFLDKVREVSNNHRLKQLQRTLLKEILGEKEMDITSVEKGAIVIQQRLRRKKVLLILDDVDKLEQLEAIVKRPVWFGLGSKVIITTRDKQLLDYHGVKRTYDVKELNKNDALQLVMWKALKKEKADPRYVKVLDHVVTYASGLPLALEVIGSNLYGKRIGDWESAINPYKRIHHTQIQDILKVSFDALQVEEKSIFLDVACCFKGYALREVEDILRARYGHNMKYHIGVLVEKSLIKLSEGKVTLHDLIEDMGKEIVRNQSPKEPGKRSRLWSTEDIRLVLKDNTGTSEIEIICLDIPISDKEGVEWDENAFKRMKNLEILVIRNGNFSKGPKCLPNSLRGLEWHRYPSHCLPSDFHPKKLDICKLPDSCFRSFEFDHLPKKPVNLTVLNFDKCKYLTQIPNVSDLQSLKVLSFKECENLTTVHDSIGILAELKILSAKGCKKLKSFPPLNLTSLERLELSYCSSLENFPEISGKMKNIRELTLEGLSKIELPSSFQNLIGLQRLYLTCEIVQLPSSIAMMPELSLFYAQDCKGCQWVKSEEGEEKVGSIVSSKLDWFFAVYCNLNDGFFPLGFKLFAQVSRLWLGANNFTFLPECIKEFQFLRYLDVSDCKHLKEIRGVPPNLKYFWAKNCVSLTFWSSSMFLNQELHEAGKTYFCFPGASIPEWFDHLSRETSTSFWFRNKFPAKVLCLLIAPVVNNMFGLFYPTPMVFINGKVQESRFHNLNKKNESMLELDHAYLFDLQVLDFDDDLFEVPLVKEWNHVEVTYEGVLETSLVKATGIHVFKPESSIDDIRFVDPYSNRKVDDDINSSES